MVEETKKLSCKIKINRINVYFCSAKKMNIFLKFFLVRALLN